MMEKIIEVDILSSLYAELQSQLAEPTASILQILTLIRGKIATLTIQLVSLLQWMTMQVLHFTTSECY